MDNDEKDEDNDDDDDADESDEDPEENNLSGMRTVSAKMLSNLVFYFVTTTCVCFFTYRYILLSNFQRNKMIMTHAHKMSPILFFSVADFSVAEFSAVDFLCVAEFSAVDFLYVVEFSVVTQTSLRFQPKILDFKPFGTR